MSKDLFYQQLLAQEQELVDTLEAIRKLKKHYNKFDAPQQSIPFNEPEHNSVALINEDSYDKGWILKDKVFYALKKIRKGTSDEVADVLHKLDSDLSLTKANRVCTIQLSRLYRDNTIGASKLGKKYKYYIKNEQNIVKAIV